MSWEKTGSKPVELTARQMAQLLKVSAKQVVRLGQAGLFTLNVRAAAPPGQTGQGKTWMRYGIPLDDAIAFKARVEAGTASTTLRVTRKDNGVKRGPHASRTNVKRLEALATRLETLLAQVVAGQQG